MPFKVVTRMELMALMTVDTLLLFQLLFKITLNKRNVAKALIIELLISHLFPQHLSNGLHNCYNGPEVTCM